MQPVLILIRIFTLSDLCFSGLMIRYLRIQLSCFFISKQLNIPGEKILEMLFCLFSHFFFKGFLATIGIEIGVAYALVSAIKITTFLRIVFLNFILPKSQIDFNVVSLEKMVFQKDFTSSEEKAGKPTYRLPSPVTNLLVGNVPCYFVIQIPFLPNLYTISSMV